jgi:hypothetical protein
LSLDCQIQERKAKEWWGVGGMKGRRRKEGKKERGQEGRKSAVFSLY